jgi:hypothetical protein
MGTHTSIYFKQEDKSLYFKYCYPEMLEQAKASLDFKGSIEAMYVKDREEDPEYTQGNALFTNEFPYDYYFEYDNGVLYEIKETNQSNRFVRVEIDCAYHQYNLRNFYPHTIYKLSNTEEYSVFQDNTYFRFTADRCLSPKHPFTQEELKCILRVIEKCSTKTIVAEMKLSEYKT